MTDDETDHFQLHNAVWGYQNRFACFNAQKTHRFSVIPPLSEDAHNANMLIVTELTC